MQKPYTFFYINPIVQIYTTSNLFYIYVLGLIEHSLGLPSYIETATTTRSSHLMVLEKRHEDLLLKKSGNGIQSNKHFLEASNFPTVIIRSPLPSSGNERYLPVLYAKT